MGKNTSLLPEVQGRVRMPDPESEVASDLSLDMLSAESSEEESIDADVKVCNMALYMLYQHWGNVVTPGQAIEMAKATIDVCMKRRILMNRSLGAEQKPASGPSLMNPLS